MILLNIRTVLDEINRTILIRRVTIVTSNFLFQFLAVKKVVYR